MSGSCIVYLENLQAAQEEIAACQERQRVTKCTQCHLISMCGQLNY